MAAKKVDAKEIRAAKDSTVTRMYQNGKSISEIMAVTRKSYQHVKETLDLAGEPPRSLRVRAAAAMVKKG